MRTPSFMTSTLGITLFVVLSTIMGMGCGSSTQTTGDKTITVTETKTVVQSVTAASAQPTAPSVLTGVGQQASQKFPLKKGLATFKLQHAGSAHFSIWLLDDKGNNVDLLANATGTFNGSKAVQIPRDGNYLLNIDADGNWTVSIEQ